MRGFAICLLASSMLLSGAKQPPDWKPGRVTGFTTALDTSSEKSKHPRRQPEVDVHVLTVAGDGTTYTVKEKRSWHDECLLVVGDSIKIAEANETSLSLLDTRGYRCTFAIVRRAKTP